MFVLRQKIQGRRFAETSGEKVALMLRQFRSEVTRDGDVFRYSLLAVGHASDIWLSVSPRDIVRAQLTSNDASLVSVCAGTEMDSRVMGSALFSRFRIARCSEQGDFRGILFLGLVNVDYRLDVFCGPWAPLRAVFLVDNYDAEGVYPERFRQYDR
jgi:hypothetical protein